MSSSKEHQGPFALLPVEILSQIFSDACLERIDSYHHSRVNKKFSQIVQPNLYAYISLYSDQPQAWEQLYRSLRSNTQLLPLVHHLELRLPPGHNHRRGWDVTPATITMALRDILGLHLPTLESFTSFSEKLNLCVYRADPMLSVRDVYLQDASLEEAATLMLLPCVQSIHIEDLNDVNIYRDPPSPISSLLVGRGSKFSTIKDITIEGGWYPHTSCSPFMSWPRELRSFQSHLNIIGLLSPTAVDHFFEPVRETLAILTIGARADEYTDVDGTFIYFDKFRCLRDLETSASLLFGSSWNRPNAERAGLYRRLPTTLEFFEVGLLFMTTLFQMLMIQQIFFDNLTPAIRTGREDEYLGSETPPDYIWITELTNLPKLKSLSIKEDIWSQDDSPNYQSFRWEPHHIIRDPFASRAIRFGASLRSYKQHAVAMDALRARRAQRRG